MLRGDGENSRSTEKKVGAGPARCMVGAVRFDRMIRTNHYNNIIIAEFPYTRFQKALPASIASRDTPQLTHEELTKLMKWKLTVRDCECTHMEVLQVLV